MGQSIIHVELGGHVGCMDSCSQSATDKHIMLSTAGIPARLTI